MSTGASSRARRSRGALVKAAVSILLAAAFTVPLALPIGPLPALGPTFNPVTGVFAGVSRDMPEKLALPGLQAPVAVREDAYAVPHIFAQNDHDVFFAQGYLVARNRMVQMDLMRRSGSGRLAEILGESLVPSDALQLTLGLRRTAEAEARTLKAEYPEVYAHLQAYADGVNAWLEEARRTHALPAPFRLLGYVPEPWTPVDSLVVQGIMTEDLALSMQPLARVVAEAKLGSARAGALFPELPVNEQHPYDPGPYPQDAPVDAATLRARALDFGPGAGVGGAVGGGEPQTAAGAPRPGWPGPAAAAQVARAGGAPVSGGAGAEIGGAAASPADFADALAGFLRVVSGAAGPLATAIFQHPGNSNNWVVDGTLTDTGKPYLAGDPHLALTLPAIWYEVHLNAPDLDVYGVSIPGTPGVVIGHNRDVAWSLTNTENQQTFFYSEVVSPQHPDAYLYKGRWVKFSHYAVDIRVKGGATKHLDIPWTVHGPVLSELPGVPPLHGLTVSMAYTGNLDSHDFVAIDRLMRAKSASDVRAALREWGSPTQNFAYATRQGDIGIISAGYYPLIAGDAKPWLLLPGTGEADWIGLIPYERVPQVHNPAWHYAFTANQREVGPGYPYYIGTTDNFFAEGYRADTIDAFLADPANRPLTQEKMAELQTSNRDAMAQRVVPALVRAVRAAGDVPADVKTAADLLARWDGVMDKDEAAPAIWWVFLDHYVKDTFGPWWAKTGLDKVPGLELRPNFAPLDQALEVLTTAPVDSPEYQALDHPGGARESWFDDPVKGLHRTREQVMVQALEDAVKDLKQRLGPDPGAWRWGELHHRLVESLLQAPALARGPFPADGDAFTPNAAGGEPSTHGPSWRMIANLADWSSSWGVYPGGQSWDPSSAHYDDQLPLWRAYRYKTLPFPATPGEAGGWVRRAYTLEPAGGGAR
ncbi:MAG: penicillin acylase family protein [Clostridia bacterium]|nr:penicillin acylase family protein [Clostridia bacterium]